jgi:hypothetical protein
MASWCTVARSCAGLATRANLIVPSLETLTIANKDFGACVIYGSVHHLRESANRAGESSRGPAGGHLHAFGCTKAGPVLRMADGVYPL